MFFLADDTSIKCTSTFA